MDNQHKAHNPDNWEVDALLAWLREAVTSLRATIEKEKSTKPASSAALISAILQLIKDDPSLCVKGYDELFEKVVAKFVRKRIVPITINDEVAGNPSSVLADELENDASSSSSSLSLELEIDNPSLNQVQGFQPELAYRQTWKDFRLIRWLETQSDESKLVPASGHHVGNDDAQFAVAGDEDLVPEDDNLSDLSSGFWREVEEDEQVEAPPPAAIDYATIMKDEIQRFRQLWNDRKLSKSQKSLSKMWSSYHNARQRSVAASIKLQAAQHLQSRLHKLELAIIESATGTKEKAVRRQCACLEQTVFDHEKMLLEYNALRSTAPPLFESSESVERKRRTEMEDDDLSDPDAIWLNSDSEDAFGREPEILEKAASCPDPSEDDLDLFISTDEEFLQEVDDMRQGSDDAQSVYDTVNGKMTTDNKSSEDSEEAELEQLVSLTPSGRKRKQVFQQSQESKRHQSDAMRRAEDDEIRALQNSQSLVGDGNIAINPGKKNDDEFIYINHDMCQILKQHQIDGIRFLWREIMLEQDDEKATGCLLSHTMGLGKTCQVITLLLTIAEASRSSSAKAKLIPQSLRRSQTLILCPPGLVTNWIAELSKWLPATSKHILGRIYDMTSAPNKLSQLQSWSENGGILVMGYAMFRAIIVKDERQHEAHILLNTATLVIADEAHNLKNSDAAVRKAADQISSKRRIALTGSPLSNNIREYWSMIDWVSPSYLGPSKEFQVMFERPIEEGSYVESTPIEQKTARVALVTLERVLQPKVHRRDATVLKDMLPKKREFIIKMSLSATQGDLYTQFVQLLRSETQRNFRIGDILAHGKSLIWIANAPAVFSRHITARRDKLRNARAKLSEDISNIEIVQLEQLALRFNNEDKHLSYKTLCFLEIVRVSIKSGDKTLLFSQSLKTLDYLSDQLRANGIGHDMLRGETDIGSRANLLKSFNEDTGFQSKWVLLISTKTGNAGFNIHGANRVVIFDFNWNPTYEEQAIGRAYRLGQRKNVFVYRFVSDGTFESVLLNTTAGKTQLSLQVVEGKRTQSMVSKDVQKFIREPNVMSPMSAGALSHWVGHDNVLDSVLELSARSNQPFITELIDAEVLRKERQPEPLDEAQQQLVHEWVERCRRGQWVHRPLGYTYAEAIQMQEIAQHHRPQTQLPPKAFDLLTPLTLVSSSLPNAPTMNSDQTPLASAPSISMLESLSHTEMQAHRGASPVLEVSDGERQDVRRLLNFNNHVTTHRVLHSGARKTGFRALTSVPLVPAGTEIIDLTESPPGKQQVAEPPPEFVMQRTNEERAPAPASTEHPAFRAAQASHSVLKQSAKFDDVLTQVSDASNAFSSKWRIRPYTQPLGTAEASTQPPVWITRQNVTTEETLTEEQVEQAAREDRNTTTPVSSPVKQNGGAYIIRSQYTSPRKHSAAAMSPSGAPLLTTPRRRNGHAQAEAQVSFDNRQTVDRWHELTTSKPFGRGERARSQSSVAKATLTADSDFMKKMFPDIQRSTQS